MHSHLESIMTDIYKQFIAKNKEYFNEPILLILLNNVKISEGKTHNLF